MKLSGDRLDYQVVLSHLLDKLSVTQVDESYNEKKAQFVSVSTENLTEQETADLLYNEILKENYKIDSVFALDFDTQFIKGEHAYCGFYIKEND